MALHFVSTAILSSDNGIEFSKEEKLESEEVKQIRIQSEKSSNKPLYEQLAEIQAKKQEEYDANTKLLFAPPKALDSEDVEFLQRLENEKISKIRNQLTEDEKLIKQFKSHLNGKKVEDTTHTIYPLIVPEKRTAEEMQAPCYVAVKKRRKSQDGASKSSIQVEEIQSRVSDINDEKSNVETQTGLSDLFGAYNSDSD